MYKPSEAFALAVLLTTELEVGLEDQVCICVCIYICIYVYR